MLQAQGVFDCIRRVAARVSPALVNELERVGMIELPTKPRHATVAEHLFVAIINQQLSGKAADAIWRRISASARERDCMPGDLFVVKLEQEVRAWGVSRNKVRALQAVREAEAQGFLDEDYLRQLSHEARAKQLCEIWGIGRWTADMVGISYFMDPDIWPNGDVAVTGTLRRIVGCTDTIKAAAPFAPYRSILARYMWHIKDAANPAVR